MNDYELEQKTKKLLKKINRITKIDFIDCLIFDFVTEIESEDMVFLSGSEELNGKKKHYNYEVPLNAVINKEEETKYLNKLRKQEGKSMNPIKLELKEKFENYDKLRMELEKEAMSVLAEINEIESVSSISLEVSKIEDGYIEFFGEERWRYGGYDSASFELPIEVIYDNEAKEEYLNKLRNKVNKKKEIEEERKLKQQKEKEEKEKAQYLELKNKYD